MRAKKLLLAEDDWIAPIVEAVDANPELDLAESTNWTVYMNLLSASFHLWALSNPVVLPDSKDKEKALSTLMAEFGAAFLKQAAADTPHLENRAKQQGLLGLDLVVH